MTLAASCNLGDSVIPFLQTNTTEFTSSFSRGGFVLLFLTFFFFMIIEPGQSRTLDPPASASQLSIISVCEPPCLVRKHYF